MFKLSDAKEATEREDSGVVVPFRNIDGTAVEGTSVTVVGSYSKTYKSNVKAFRKGNQERQYTPTEEEIEAALPACAVKSWEGFEDQGKPFEYTQDNAVQLMLACPWFADEVRAKSYDHASFFPKPSANS